MSAERLSSQRNIWVATVRPDGRPHLAPVWFVAEGKALYFVTDPKSVKARNLQRNPKVAVSLEDGDAPYIVEGLAVVVEPSAEVIALFKHKYDWDITTDKQYTQVYEVSVKKRVMDHGR
ncbi:MAG: pyridoxamine 5'-phosphate oxidase family protein [Chloroflexi bacterium]|nr:pyridoxamine 5'-phosphate oxidase family protein [Chloroflexota bacterium]MBI5829300.1 pyridoxamine 5'-phosphate oxidase family protein [Chloroflexota bacterium]